jgi:hypothetical protein
MTAGAHGGPDGLLDGDGTPPTLDLVAAEAKDVHAAGDIDQQALQPRLVVAEEAVAEADQIRAGLGSLELTDSILPPSPYFEDLAPPLKPRPLYIDSGVSPFMMRVRAVRAGYAFGSFVLALVGVTSR